MPTDWRTYWNRAPDLAASERSTKRVIFVAALLIGGSVLLFAEVGSATLGGWALVSPLMLAGLGWASASKLTRRGSGKLRVAWYAFALLIGLAFGLEPALAGRWAVAGIALFVSGTIAAATFGASRDLDRTRARRIAQGRQARSQPGSLRRKDEKTQPPTA